MRDRVPYPRGTVEVSPQRSSSMTDTGTTFIRRISMSHRLVLPQTNAPVCPGLAEPSGGFARGRASTPIRTWSARAIAPPPGSPGAATDADQPHRQRVRQTSLPRHSGCRSTERPSAASSSTTPSGPARPFRLARVPRSGMTNTNVRLGTHRPQTDLCSRRNRLHTPFLRGSVFGVARGSVLSVA